jgi:hypothetical protein
VGACGRNEQPKSCVSQSTGVLYHCRKWKRRIAHTHFGESKWHKFNKINNALSETIAGLSLKPVVLQKLLLEEWGLKGYIGYTMMTGQPVMR